MLQGLTFLRVRFTVRAHGPLWFGEYAGAAVRGALGHALLRHYCIFAFSACRSTCPIADRCGYRYLFEAGSSSHDLQGVTTEAPRPYVIWAALEQPGVGSGETFQVYLTLFGRAAEELPRVVRTVEEAMPRGLGLVQVPCELVRVDLLDAGDKTLAVEGIPSIPPTCALSLEGSEKAQEVRFFFQTPLRLKRCGVPTSSFTFGDLWRALKRRISLLGVYHCDLKPQDFRFPNTEQEVRVVDSSLYWVKREHYSFRQRQRNAIGGLMGSITFAGELGPYLPYVRLGEITHVGSGCVYGLGKYRIEVV